MAQELRTARTPSQTGQWGGGEKVLSLRQRISISLSRPVDIAGLVYFRIAFYSLMCWEAWRFLAGNWVGLNFVGKEFYFTYWPLTFVHPWPGNGLYIHLYVMAAVAFGLALGLFYRVLAVHLPLFAREGVVPQSFLPWLFTLFLNDLRAGAPGLFTRCLEEPVLADKYHSCLAYLAPAFSDRRPVFLRWHR
jgi:hypothetical protein